MSPIQSFPGPAEYAAAARSYLRDALEAREDARRCGSPWDRRGARRLMRTYARLWREHRATAARLAQAF